MNVAYRPELSDAQCLSLSDSDDTPAELARGVGHGVETLEGKDVAN